MNLIALLSLALLMGTPMLEGAEISPTQLLKDLQEKITSLGKAEIDSKMQEASRMQGKDVESEIRIAGLKKLSDEERELYDLLMFNDLGATFRGVHNIMCEYLSRWHEVGQFEGHPSGVTAITTYWDYKERREKLISGDNDGIIKIWDIGTQRAEYTVSAADATQVTALASTHREKGKPILFAAAYGTTCDLFKINKGKISITKIPTKNRSTITSLSMFEDGTIVEHATPASYRAATLSGLFKEDFHTMRCIALPEHKPTALSEAQSVDYKEVDNGIRPHHELFASGDANGTIYIWDTKNPSCTHTFQGHTGKITGLILGKLDQFGTEKGICTVLQLISASEDGTIKIWNMSDKACALPIFEDSENIEE